MWHGQKPCIQKQPDNTVNCREQGTRTELQFIRRKIGAQRGKRTDNLVNQRPVSDNVPVRCRPPIGKCKCKDGRPQHAVFQRKAHIGPGKNCHRFFCRFIALAGTIESGGKTVKRAGVDVKDQVIKIVKGVVKRAQRAACIGSDLSRL